MELKLLNRSLNLSFRKTENKTNGEKPGQVAQKEFIREFLKLAKQYQKESTLAQITPWQLYRYQWTLTDWRNAIDDAENVNTPDKFDLIEIFHDIIDDYAVFSSMQQRTSKVINSKLMFLNPDGSENEEIKPFFINADGTQKPWFRRWLKIAQDVKYYGFEVAELGAFINDEFKSFGNYKAISKIPEENLVPTQRRIKKDARAGITNDNSISMDFSEFSPRLIPMGNEKDLGLINKTVPFVIWKYIFQNWRQHAEIFGQPFREGRTDIYDNDRVKQMAEMFEQMVSSAYGIFHPDDEINFIETTKTDAYQIYSMLIDKCDYAITRIFLSQTSTTDEKSFVGSAQIHDDVLNDVIMSDRLDINEYFTEILIPKLKGLGIIESSLDISLTWIIEQHISLTDWSKIIRDLSVNYDIPDDEIQKRFDIAVTKKEPQQPFINAGGDDEDEDEENKSASNKLTDIMARTQRYYQKLWQGQ